MANIEAAYQQVCDKIIDGHFDLTSAEHNAITDFYILWNLRDRENSEDKIYPQFSEFKPEKLVSDKNQQEKLEKEGVLFWNEKGEIPNRFLTGSSLQMQLWIERERMESTTWGIFKAKPDNGEFLVPDRISLHSVVPVTPDLCLVAGSKSKIVDFKFVARVNGLSLENSERYYFAKSIGNCPVLLQATLRDSLIRENLNHSDITTMR
ncbi:DUF4238 domain-containing protein [Acidovorax sp. LjRoot66]|uniref:hypothetical protein n=1 Tax=Acidovorax sp. LjRoot66 TaxID=3342334 RepID=UPI003ECF7333